MKYVHFILIAFAVLLTSCSTTKKGIFTVEKRDTAYNMGGTYHNLKKHIHSNDSLRIIVREIRNIYQRGYEGLPFMEELHNAIEKELTLVGIAVEDRQAYNKIYGATKDIFGI